jgi:serine protease AprX
MRSLSLTTNGEQLPIIVRYGPARKAMRHREALRGAMPGYGYRLRPLEHLHANASAIAALEADPDVLAIYQDAPVHAFLNTSVPLIQVPRVWETGLTGEGVHIAIVDTGIDLHHPDFVGRIGGTADFTGEGLLDRHGHGTHCASIAAGSGAADGGSYRGVAPKATIYAAKVLRSDGQGMMSDVMAGVEWAVAQNVQVISLSLGGIGPSDGKDALSDLCNAAVEAGVVVVTAAGNDGPHYYTVGPPGAAAKVITIGACDDREQIATFSSRGPTADGRLKPDVVLPGVEVIAARAEGTTMGSVIDAHYVAASGTSMAAPHCAGLCALLLQGEPELVPEQIKARLIATAVSLNTDPYAQGAGRADAWRAVSQPDTPTPTPPPVEPPSGSPQGCLVGLLRMAIAAMGQFVQRR